MLSTNRPALTDVVQLVQDSNIKRPSTILFVPVNLLSSPSTIVGSTSVVFSWDSIILTILPTYVTGLIVVLKTSTTVFTYDIVNGAVQLTGAGDFHDTAYDSYQRVATVSMPYATSASTITYTFYIYPSSDYQNLYMTTRPRDTAVEVVVVIVATAFIFLIYDYLVSAREATLTAVALSASSVVNGLFPAFVRARLFGNHGQHPATDDAGHEAHMSHLDNRQACFPCGRHGPDDVNEPGKRPSQNEPHLFFFVNAPQVILMAACR